MPLPSENELQQLYRRTRCAALGGLAVTLCLAAAKLLGGWFGNSLALISDAVHSLGDALASAGIYAALVWAERPADVEHPYGHTRAEAVSGFGVALLLVLSGLGVGCEAIRTWGNHSPAPQPYTVLIALVSVLVNEALYQYSSRVARQTGSRAVMASAWDQRMDAFGSAIVLLSLAVAAWGGSEFRVADHAGAIAVSLLILWAGGHLLWNSLQELMDHQADPETLASVRQAAAAVPGVRAVEKLLIRKTGLEYLVDIHVEVDPDITVRAGHVIAHAVKRRIMDHFVTVKDVLVHVEPAAAASPGRTSA